MWLKRLFQKHQWHEGDCARVWCHSESNHIFMYVLIKKIDGECMTLEYLNKTLKKELEGLDPSWWFLTEIHKKELKHLAYDQMDDCVELIRKNRRNDTINRKN